MKLSLDFQGLTVCQTHISVYPCVLAWSHWFKIVQIVNLLFWNTDLTSRGSDSKCFMGLRENTEELLPVLRSIKAFMHRNSSLVTCKLANSCGTICIAKHKSLIGDLLIWSLKFKELYWVHAYFNVCQLMHIYCIYTCLLNVAIKSGRHFPQIGYEIFILFKNEYTPFEK